MRDKDYILVFFAGAVLGALVVYVWFKPHTRLEIVRNKEGKIVAFELKR